MKEKTIGSAKFLAYLLISIISERILKIKNMKKAFGYIGPVLKNVARYMKENLPQHAIP